MTAFFHGANYEAVQIDLYTFALTTGEVFRYTSGNTPLAVPAGGFPRGSINVGAERSFALGPCFGRSKVTTKIGVEPTELEIDVLAGPDDTVGATTFVEAVRVGLFDGATVELDRFFAPPQIMGSAAARHQSRLFTVVLRPGCGMRDRPQPDRNPGKVVD